MRAWLLLLVVAGCSSREPAAPREPAAVEPPRDAIARDAGSPAVPGLRLPDGTTPLAYALRLELDPDRETFSGQVEIRIRLDAPADRVWLHAVNLELTTARFRAGSRSGALVAIAGEQRADGMHGFRFDAAVAAGEATLVFEYTGQISSEAGTQEGLFRQQAGEQWFLYSQAQSMFARRIVPCFDEPRFKPSWQVTLVVPKPLVALGNGGQVSERALSDGRREVALAEVTAMPSYLLAVAVGPFVLVDAGRVGRTKVPVRVAVAPGDARRSTIAAAKLPAVVDALERYLDQPLPLAKLDLVAVPRFFGAMENVGLITFESTILVATPDAAAVSRFIRFAAHELAHQWFGNAVTPAWWDDLWLSEGFATWLGDKISIELGGVDDAILRAQLARLDALAADDADDARPLRRAVASSDDVDERFDAIAYEKAGAVLGMFERFAGGEPFRAAIVAYLRDHTSRTATARDFVSALGAATTPAIAMAFFSYLDRAGAPLVEFALRCDGAPGVELRARGGVTVPVCIRHARGRACSLVDQVARIPLAACPSWLAANAGGEGYYRVAGGVAAPHAATALLSPTERLAHADDLGATLLRGELAITVALRELAALATMRDATSQLAALALARAIDPLVEDAHRPTWSAWLAKRFAARLGAAALLAPRTTADRELRDRLVPLLAAHAQPAATAAAVARVEQALRTAAKRPAEFVLALAVARGPGLFERIVAGALASAEGERREEWLESLGLFGAELAPRLVALTKDPRFTAAQVWPAIAVMLSRPAARTAAWRAVRAQLPTLLSSLETDELPLVIDATRSLCDATARAEVAAAFDAKLDAAMRTSSLTPALAAIDRCITRRAALGDLAAALR